MTQAELKPPWWAVVSFYVGAIVLFSFGYLREFFGLIFKRKQYRPPPGYAPLLVDFDDFYTRRLYTRIQDCWNRPISSSPGTWIDVMLRDTRDYNKTLYLTGETRRCLNLGSYNYLGFGDAQSETLSPVLKALDEFGVSTGAARATVGTTRLHAELEALVARFLDKEDAFVFGMGFGTNAAGLPALFEPGTLLVSDEFNHASIVSGARSSGATIKVFRHNDMRHLEQVLRRAIIDGQPRAHRPWRRIVIVVEGIYSMEGQTCSLREIMRLKKRYRCYLYVDEAHSIGAMGATGRGITEHAGVDPRDVDILMGTFTKSFGAVGGYIAGSRELVASLRLATAGSLYSASISPPACAQVIAALSIIAGLPGYEFDGLGQRKIKALHANANFFRQRLIEMGCNVLGEVDSPVVPVMLYTPAKIPAFSRLALERNLAVVVVGYPASPILLTRARFCVSAAHTREDLEFALQQISEIADRIHIKYAKGFLCS